MSENNECKIKTNKNNECILFQYDIFETVMEYIDPITVDNLINTCEASKNLYYSNIKLINKLLVQKTLYFFKLLKPGSNIRHYLNCLDTYELNYFKSHCHNIFKYFHNHPESTIGDFLIYHIENVYRYEPNHFFKYLITLCDKKIYFQPPYQTIHNNNNDNSTAVMKYKLNTNDIIYISTYCNYNDYCIILEHFEIKPNMISYIIKDLLIQKRNKKNAKDAIIDIDEKIYKSLDYFFYKYVFGRHVRTSNFNLFLNHILLTLLQNGENDFINFIMERKARYQRQQYNRIELNYQTLITTAIESNNLKGVKIIWSVLNRNLELDQNDDMIIITAELITNICKYGYFKMLNWVVETLLSNIINLKSYISAIQDGIFLYSYSYFRDDNSNNEKKLNELLFLNDYLSKENKTILNDHINMIVKTNRTPNDIELIKFK